MRIGRMEQLIIEHNFDCIVWRGGGWGGGGAPRELRRNGQSILKVAGECQQSVSAGSASIPSQGSI